VREDAISEPGIPHIWILNDLNLLRVSCPVGNHLLQGTLEDPCVQYKPRHDFRDIYGEFSGSYRGYLLVVPSGEVGGVVCPQIVSTDLDGLTCKIILWGHEALWLIGLLRWPGRGRREGG